MNDVFNLSATLSSGPVSGSPSGGVNVIAPIHETIALVAKEVGEYALTSDGPVSIGFGGLTQAHVVVMTAVGGKVTARVTSSDGVQQSVPVDPLFILINDVSPVLAIDVARVPGVATLVRVFLGQRL